MTSCHENRLTPATGKRAVLTSFAWKMWLTLSAFSHRTINLRLLSQLVLRTVWSCKQLLCFFPFQIAFTFFPVPKHPYVSTNHKYFAGIWSCIAVCLNLISHAYRERVWRNINHSERERSAVSLVYVDYTRGCTGRKVTPRHIWSKLWKSWYRWSLFICKVSYI